MPAKPKPTALALLLRAEKKSKQYWFPDKFEKTLLRLSSAFYRHGHREEQGNIPQSLNSPDAPTDTQVRNSTEQIDDTPSIRDTSCIIDREDVGEDLDHINLWSAAYMEAYTQATKHLNEEERNIIRKSHDLEELFSSLNKTNEKHTNHSLFRKGLKKLSKPLGGLKTVLDFATPLMSLEPTAAAASGVVQNVISLAICICGAEAQLEQQITQMLEKIPIINQCDVLGQKIDIGVGNGIHRALVEVYKDLIAFYLATIGILNRKVFVFSLICEQFQQRLSPIIQDFHRHVGQLKEQIENATSETIVAIRKLLQDNKIEKLLNTGKNESWSGFHNYTTKLRADEACQWIAGIFRQWYDSPISQPMIISGDMGCGKSVTMSYVIDEVIKRNKRQIPSPLICYHYCKDDKTGKVDFIYSSLVLQLLEQQEALKVEFHRWYETTKEDRRIDPVSSSEELGAFLSNSVEMLERPLFIILDGFDECDYNSRVELITFLGGLSEKVPSLKICLSSRNQRDIEELLADSLSATLEVRIPTTDEQRDIVIVQHIVTKSLRFLKSEVRSLVIERLSKLAQGSAIWVRLSVELIQSRKISAQGPMEIFIQEEIAHTKISQLYAKLFAQASDSDEKNKIVITNALQIIAAARRPLSLIELGWAVAVADPDLPAETKQIRQIQQYVDERRVLSLILPFISQDLKRERVQLVHQSLKELVNQAAPSDWGCLHNKPSISKTEVQLRQNKLEADLLRLCIKYLLIEEVDRIKYTHPSRDPKRRPRGFFDRIEAFSPYFDPAEQGFGDFFSYASCFWLDHCKEAGTERFPAISDIVSLTRPNSMRLKNWLGVLEFRGSGLGSRIRSDKVDPLLVVSAYGPEAALHTLLQTYGISSSEFLPGMITTVLKRLVSDAEISKIKILFGYFSRDDSFAMELCWQSMAHCQFLANDERRVELFELVKGLLPTIIQGQRGYELLCRAAYHGRLQMIESLFNEATHSMQMALLRHHPAGDCFGQAVLRGHLDVVRFLLKQEGSDSHLRYVDCGGGNVFHRASHIGDPEIVRLLITHYKEGVNHLNNEGNTPLDCFVANGITMPPHKIESVKLLLTLGEADVTIGRTGFSQLLREVVMKGDVDMCQVSEKSGGADPLKAMHIENE